jgi:hypothetical protein
MIIGYQKENKGFGMQKVPRKGYLKKASAPSTKVLIEMDTISHEVSPNTIPHPHLLLMGFYFPLSLSRPIPLPRLFYFMSRWHT